MTSLNRPNYQPPSLAHSLKRHLDTRSNESLIGDFVCMHSAGGLTPGHLYCRKNSLAFYASAMRGENKILLSFDDVIRIKKPNHLGYMDNAIEIICKDDRTYTFVQFPNRDAAYTLLTRLFRSYVKTKKELHDSKSNSISPQNNESRASITQELSREEKENDVEKDVEKDAEKKEEQAESKSETSEDKSLQSSNSEKSNAENDDDAVSVNYLDNYSETIKAVLPVSAEQAYELYFDEGCVFPYGEHLAHTGGYNVKVGKWKVNEQSHRPERRMHFNKVLQGIFYDTEMGTKSIQSCRKGNDGTITIAMKDKLINVPYAESYYIKEKFVLSPTEESEDKCLITGSVKTVFTGDCCMKEMLHDRVCEDKKKEHEMWLKYIEEHKLFQKPGTESNQQIVLPENEDSKPSTTEEEKIAAINPKEIAHGKDDIAEGLRLPLTPRPSIDKEFTSNEDADKMEGKTCSDMLKEMSEKATIQPKKLAKTLKAVNKTLPEAEEPEKEKQSSLSALEEEKPATNQQTNSLASVDSSSKAFTGIFDSPVQSKTSGLKDIYGKIRDSAVSKKLGHEMEKVKDFIVKQEVKTEKNLSHNEQKLSLALAKANKMGRILVIAFVVLFFLFVTTTVHLSSKIGRLQENCNLSSI